MSNVLRLFEYTSDKAVDMGGITDDSEIVRSLTQYHKQGNKSIPTGDTVATLSKGLYKIVPTMQGIAFEQVKIKTDEILRFEDERYNQVIDEIEEFWKIGSRFDRFGFSHKRGVLLYGEPGTGKSVLTKLVMENMVARDGVVFIAKRPSTLVGGIKEFREVEPERQVLAVLEDVDELSRYNEHALLELFDGENQEDGVLYLATTNYIDRLPPRMLRAGRFDRKIKVYNPPAEGRRSYFQHKLGQNEDEQAIETLVKETDGFSFSQLKELVVSVYCLGQKQDEAIKRIKTNLEEVDESLNPSQRLMSLLEG